MIPLSSQEALELLSAEGPLLYDLLARAGRARAARSGQQVNACSIINARSGGCSQDCAFCAQSRRSSADIQHYALVGVDEIVSAARDAAAGGAARFSIVTSGKAVARGEELDTICRAVTLIAREVPVEPCASLGHLDRDAFMQLREAGLTRYHHNLETARSHFAEICTTRTWAEGVETIRLARELGLSTCGGGIFGMGESPAQRIELLADLRDLGVDSVPLNFLNPIAGTPLADRQDLSPQDCLRLVAVARLMMPEKEIRLCGGREVNLRDLQSWMFLAGADGLMVGGYLTTPGRSVDEDRQMIHDAGLRLDTEPEESS